LKYKPSDPDGVAVAHPPLLSPIGPLSDSGGKGGGSDGGNGGRGAELSAAWELAVLEAFKLEAFSILGRNLE
jgi:hypothetical protein